MWLSATSDEDRFKAFTGISDGAIWPLGQLHGQVHDSFVDEAEGNNQRNTNASHYGVGRVDDSMNGQRMIQHSDSWQGSTCTINRYVDDKLTVVVLRNLDAAHASPVAMAHVIAGLVHSQP